MVDSLLKPGPRGGARARRLGRTILLGTVAVGVGVYWVADSFGVDWDEMQDYLGASLVFVAGFMVAGMLAGLALWFLRRWLRR